MPTPSKTSEEAIYYEAVAKDTDEREAYLQAVCGRDADLLARVRVLLKAHEVRDSFLESAPWDPAAILDPPVLTEGAGTVIGRYKLLERIGEGGMAVVYMAEQEQPLRRKVALKIIKLGMDTKQVIARFEAERQALALMDHPHIAKVFDAGATETGRPYFVMELVQGVSITEYCDRNSLSTKERLRLFIQVCNAVQHAHQKGIIHRDIKPSNVLVTHHDGRPVPKVIDFGIAKATNQRLTEKTLFTRYAHLIGTPAYMSPEQAELNDLDIDTRSDIYSLGVLLYELLTGTTPFSEEELRKAGYIEMQRVIREQEPVKPSTKLTTRGETLTSVAEHRGCTPDLLRKAIRGDLDWIVMKSLEKDRTRRYDSTAQLVGDVQRHLNHEAVFAGPPGAWYHMGKFLQRHGKLVAVVAGGLVIVLMGFITSMVLYLRAEESRAAADAARAEATSVADFLTNDLLASVFPERSKGPQVTVAYLLDTASEGLEQKLAHSPLAEAKVRDVLGVAYQKIGKYREAQPHLERALALRRAQLGNEAPDTLTSLDHLAWLYWYQGRHDEGMPLAAQALAARQRVLGRDDPNTLESMVHLAWLEEREEEATALAETAYRLGRETLGADHPVTLAAAVPLAMGHLMNRRNAEAQALVPPVYERSRRVLGEENETTLALMSAYVWVLTNSERFEESLELGERALEVAQRVVGEENPITILAMTGLGWVYRMQGRYQEAEAPLTRSWEIARRFLGADHAMSLCASLRLAVLYRKQGRIEEHERLILDTLERGRRTHSEDYYLIGHLKFWLMKRSEELAELAQEQEASGDHQGAAGTLAKLQEIRRIFEEESRRSTEND